MSRPLPYLILFHQICCHLQPRASRLQLMCLQTLSTAFMTQMTRSPHRHVQRLVRQQRLCQWRLQQDRAAWLLLILMGAGLVRLRCLIWPSLPCRWQLPRQRQSSQLRMPLSRSGGRYLVIAEEHRRNAGHMHSLMLLKLLQRAELVMMQALMLKIVWYAGLQLLRSSSSHVGTLYVVQPALALSWHKACPVPCAGLLWRPVCA